MRWEPPTPAEVWRAIDAYLAIAYEGITPPQGVAERLSQLRSTPVERFFECEAFERADDRLALRLGNRFYPHMKLVVEGAATGAAHFRADTHDRHVLDLVGASPSLRDLISRNEAMARAVEAAWAGRGLRTRAAYWRDELARWRGARR